MTPNRNRPLTVEQAARVLKVSTVVVRKRLRRGTLPGFRLEDSYRSWRVLMDGPGAEPIDEPARMDPGRTLALAIDHYERARDQHVREPTSGPDLARFRQLRDHAEANLLALLQSTRSVHHHRGRAYWSHDGELHRTESRGFRSQTE